MSLDAVAAVYARRKRKIPNPLNAVDSIWKAAAGPTQQTPKPSLHPPIPTTYIPDDPRRKRRGASGYSKGRLPG